MMELRNGKKYLKLKHLVSGFQKREMILLTQEQYPRTISIEFYRQNKFIRQSSVKDNVKLR